MPIQPKDNRSSIGSISVTVSDIMSENLPILSETTATLLVTG